LGRENPFKAVINKGTVGKTTYKKDTRENFTEVKTKLPNSARILKKIDWHDELILKKVKDGYIFTLI